MDNWESGRKWADQVTSQLVRLWFGMEDLGRRKFKDPDKQREHSFLLV